MKYWSLNQRQAVYEKLAWRLESISNTIKLLINNSEVGTRGAGATAPPINNLMGGGGLAPQNLACI